MAYESIKVDIIPGAENAEVLHFSQFDNKRPFFIELFNGGAEFIPESGMSLTLECRKRDGNIVIISNSVVTDNVAEFSTTEQLTACYGDNTAEIKIVDDNDLVIGSANFIINVEKSPTCGGLTSESEIDNLTQQIEDITQQVIGDDYYNKTQTDALLANKANASDLPDMSQYYTKQQTDNLLNSMLPVATASGNPCTFETEIAAALQGLTAEIVASGGGGTPSTPIPIVGHSELHLTRCGINQWNEVTERGNFNADGSENIRQDTLRTKNYIPVVGGATYYLHQGNLSASDWSYVVWYDENKAIIGNRVVGYGTLTAPSNACYLRIGFNTAYGTTYNDNISVNYPSSLTDYYQFDTPTPYLVSFGQTVYGGVLDANADKVRITMTQLIDLSTLTWNWQSTWEAWYTYELSTQIKGALNNDTVPNIIAEKYQTTYLNKILTKSEDNCVGCSNISSENKLIAIRNNSDSATPTGYLTIELATPIVIDVPSISVFAENGVNNITSDGGGDVNVSYKDTIQHYIDSRL